MEIKIYDSLWQKINIISGHFQGIEPNKKHEPGYFFLKKKKGMITSLNYSDHISTIKGRLRN